MSDLIASLMEDIEDVFSLHGVDTEAAELVAYTLEAENYLDHMKGIV